MIKIMMIKLKNVNLKIVIELLNIENLKVWNCHLKDTKYEYCQYHRPKNSINKNFPYKSIFNKVNIPLHYFNLANENILNDYHDYIYKALKNNKFKFPIKITIYAENLLYDPFNSNMFIDVNVEHIENYENYFKNSIMNINDVCNTIVDFNDYYINIKIDMLNIHYNRKDYSKDDINKSNVLDFNIKQKLSEKIEFDNKYSRKIYLELCNLISYQIDNVSKTFEILHENDINVVFYIIFLILAIEYHIIITNKWNNFCARFLQFLMLFSLTFHASFIPPGIKLNDRQEIGVAGA